MLIFVEWKSRYIAMATWTIRWFLAGPPFLLYRWQASATNSETMCPQTSDMVTLFTKLCMGLHSWLFSLFVVLLVIACQIICCMAGFHSVVVLFWNQTIRGWRWNKSFFKFPVPWRLSFRKYSILKFRIGDTMIRGYCLVENNVYPWIWAFWSFQVHGRVQALECRHG